MSQNLETEDVIFSVVSRYSPQVGCENKKRKSGVMQSIPRDERVVVSID